jgi:hypothetical protein
MVTSFLDLSAYNLEGEWTLTWFPTRATANLQDVRMRGGTINHRTTDAPFRSGNSVGHLLAQGDQTDKTEDSLEPNELVLAFITVAVNASGIFVVDLEAKIGSTSRKKTLMLAPDTKTPFMINVRARSGNQAIQNTAAVFQGVFTTGSRLSLVDVAVRLFGP